jgi:hypothetical protein
MALHQSPWNGTVFKWKPRDYFFSQSHDAYGMLRDDDTCLMLHCDGTFFDLEDVPDDAYVPLGVQHVAAVSILILKCHEFTL